MGLISFLIAIVIIAFLALSHFSNPTNNVTPQNAKQIETNAQDVVNKAQDRDKLEQSQIKNIDLPK